MWKAPWYATPAASDDASVGRAEGMTDAQEPRCKQAENDGNDRARERAAVCQLSMEDTP